MRRRIVLTEVEHGYWMAEVPSLPGCVSQGANKEQALAHIKQAATFYLKTMQELGQSVPAEDGEGITEVPTFAKRARV